MNLTLADEAVELGKVVESAIRDIGGMEVARRAEADPSVRTSVVGPVLEELGLWDIDVAAGAVEVEAAALACRAAGRFGLPYPVAERLARPPRADVDAVAFVDLARPRAGMADLGLRWVAIDGRGRTAPVTSAHPLATTLGGFVCELEVGSVDDWTEGDEASRRTLTVLLTLSAWTLLGTLQGAVDLTRAHVVAREQFGKPLASFQAVQFQLADAFVAVQGLQELARYALASVEADRPDALVDAVALRSCAEESAELVLRIAHQLHGATGFCDETSLSWLSRASHPARYLPFGQADTERWLTELVEAEGFTGLFTAGEPLKVIDLSDDFDIADDGPVRIVTINRPDKLNAFSEAMHHELSRVWERIESDAGARAVVLTGAGRTFSAGGDFDDFEQKRVDLVYRRRSMGQARRLVEQLLAFRLPIVAAVNGAAVGMGCTIVTLCDVVFMAETAFLADPHVSAALVAGDGAAATWPQLIGLLRAKRYILTGDRIPADEARAIGLANFVVPVDELMPAAVAFAHRLAGQPPQAVQATKLLLNEHLVRDASSILSHGLALEFESHDTPEYKTAIERLRPDPK